MSLCFYNLTLDESYSNRNTCPLLDFDFSVYHWKLFTKINGNEDGFSLFYYYFLGNDSSFFVNVINVELIKD